MGTIYLYAPEKVKLFEGSAAQQFFFTAPALLLVFVAIGDETASPLLVKQPARSRAEVLELDDEGNVVRSKATI